MIKYLFANVNFSGKISRAEDQRKLNAIIEDLISRDLVNCIKAPPNVARGHYGFPKAEENLLPWVMEKLPDADPCEIYGFNRNSERYILSKRSADIMLRLYLMNKQTIIAQNIGYQDLEVDLENTSMKISLAKSSLHTQSKALLDISDVDSIEIGEKDIDLQKDRSA